jgi:hypothetical protein
LNTGPALLHSPDWPTLWGQLRSRLVLDGYQPGTRRLYRQILRDLRMFLQDRYNFDRPGHP